MLRIDDMQRQAVDLFRASDMSLKKIKFYDIINSPINKNLAVNFHSTIGLILLTKPMVGVFSPLNYLY